LFVESWLEWSQTESGTELTVKQCGL